MERRYPQMCAECEPKVEKGLREASYTARTDHLRRMMDRTRTQRKEVKSKGLLDMIDWTGRWIWHIGYILQFWWHVAILLSIFSEYYSSADGSSWVSLLLRIASRARVHKLPHGDRVIRWALNMSMFSLPWNPRFKQTIRGFTTHIIGFKEWYMYQILTFPRFKPNTPQKNESTPVSRKDPNDLGGILDDILQSPSAARSQPNNSSPLQSPLQSSPPIGRVNGRAGGISQPSGSFYNGYVQRNGANSSFGSLNLSEQPPVSSRPGLGLGPAEPQVQYDEEMDWSPSASQHRAFSTYNPYKVKNTNPRFSDTPIEPKAGPIWYKVPPAPTTPAQRLRNPPMKPLIRESPKEAKENFFSQNSRSDRGRVDIGPSKPSASARETIFSNPTFYAPEPKDDPRDGLTHMFASSFSISPDPDDQETRRRNATAARNNGGGGGGIASFFSRLANNINNKTSSSSSSPPQRNRPLDRAIELVVLLIALAAWIRALGGLQQQEAREGEGEVAALPLQLHGFPVALASLAACLLVSIRLAADLLADEQMAMLRRIGNGNANKPPPSALAPSCANLGWLQVVAALSLMWTVWSGGGGVSGGDGAIRACGAYGNALFGVVIAHQAWHVFV
ncbi:hypothetical protein SLS62_011173 [Diatrype stigma]|uniref:Ima1 N-terminal domain-containing protein n=1 Tax=Diatrype stigma TaxID=117547 RepID=A0AAN9UCL1_9PEZI